MGKVKISTISKKYEELYKKCEGQGNVKDESFYAINNALIFCFFVKKLNMHYEESDFFEYQKIIETLYGAQIFFNNFKKTPTYYSCLKASIVQFTNMFDSEQLEMIELEQTLGNVLEKHINRRTTGSYYTPDDATKYITWNALLMTLLCKCDIKLIDKIKRKYNLEIVSEILNLNKNVNDLMLEIVGILNNQEKNDVLNILYNIKVIDPTCGSGAFIIVAFEFVEQMALLLSNGEVDYSKVLNCLYGLDISCEAIQLTKVRMLIRLVNSNIDIEKFDVFFNKHFIVENALTGSDYKICEPGFDWKTFGTQFDCVVGNPPYVESKINSYKNFVTNKCGNLYAHVIERSCNIVRENGYVAFIVPLSLISTKRMQPARDYLEFNSKSVYYASFADRPGCIFTGVHQRLVIFFANIGKSINKNIYSSRYNYWYKDERKNLFNNINFHQNNYKGILPKIGSPIEESIYSKLLNNKYSFDKCLIADSDFPIYLSTRIGFWNKAFLENRFSSKEFRKVYAKNQIDRYLLVAILNSSIFYFYWVISSDCWHLTNSNLELFTINLDCFNDIDKKIIINLVDNLMADLEKNKKYINTKQAKFEYKHKYSKKIIDKIDDQLANSFGLSKTEIEYVKRFTEKYRMNNMEV